MRETKGSVSGGIIHVGVKVVSSTCGKLPVHPLPNEEKRILSPSAWASEMIQYTVPVRRGSDTRMEISTLVSLAVLGSRATMLTRGDSGKRVSAPLKIGILAACRLTPDWSSSRATQRIELLVTGHAISQNHSALKHMSFCVYLYTFFAMLT